MNLLPRASGRVIARVGSATNQVSPSSFKQISITTQVQRRLDGRAPTILIVFICAFLIQNLQHVPGVEAF